MGVEVRPFGVTCNIQCQYCYQNPMRDAGNLVRSYDLEKMQAAIAREGRPFTLFGGEPLLMPKPDLETLWAWGFERFGSNSVQTNGTLIDDDHARMFKQYRVSVGISIDGPGELNDVRWAGSLERTRAQTAQSEAAIERLCREGPVPSLIVTLSRCNAAGDRLPRLLTWFKKLELLGIKSARLHVLEVESALVRAKYALDTEENLKALIAFAELEPELHTLKLDLFEDLRRLLLGRDNATTCVWNACDPYTTAAVRGIEGTGQSSNCGRTNKDGVDFTKADRAGYERYLMLYQTPQAFGGCQGCRFFLMCKGQCPGTALDGDWRNRTEHCDLWKRLFRAVEGQLLEQGQSPLSVQPERPLIEQALLDAWRAGRNSTIQQALAQRDKGNSRPGGTSVSGHGDAPHGDTPHGDTRREPEPIPHRTAPTA